MAERRIIPRSEWGARHRDGWGTRPVRDLEVWLHHSVTQAPDLVPPFTDDYAAVRSIEGVGASRFGGMSYTYLATPAGLLFQGHSLDRIGAHTAGHNTRGIGIVLVGNYESTSPTAEQEAAVAWLLQHLRGLGAIRSARLTGGHRDTKSTACPGSRAYARISAINALAGGIPVGGGAIVTPAPVTKHAMGWPVLAYGMVSEYVAALQRFLVSRGFKLAVDRSYGPATRAAVREFQRQRGLAVDGVTGPATQAEMKSAGAVIKPAPAPSKPAPAPSGGALSRGSSGARVRALQDRLRRNYPLYAGKLAVDGHYGPATEAAVREFQRRAGLAVDGVAGPATHRALGLSF